MPILMFRRQTSMATALGAATLLVASIVTSISGSAVAAEARVGLGTAADFAILAGSTVANTGPSVISGDIGLSPGTSVTGFPPGVVVDGTQHISDGVALTAKDDLVTAYNDAAGRPTSANVTGQDLGGMTLSPGVYEASTTMALTGNLTLDAQGNPDAVFIFKAGSTLIAATSSTVNLINGGSPCNVAWQVGSSATLGTAARFVGSILALTSATLGTTASVEGRVLARNGAVTLDTNTITAPACGAVPSATSSATPTQSTGPSTSSSPTGPGGASSSVPTASSNDSDETLTSAERVPSPTVPTPIVPRGHPHTGLGGTQNQSGSTPFGLVGFGLCAAVAAGWWGFRRTRSR